MRRIPFTAIASLLVVCSAACTTSPGDGNKAPTSAAAHDGPDEKPDHPEPADTKPDTTPDTTPNAKVAIASAMMVQDCPHQDARDAAPVPANAPAQVIAPPAEPSSVAISVNGGSAEYGPGGGGFDSCQQSTMQLTLSPTGEVPPHVRVLAVRLLRADGRAQVGTLTARSPQRWIDGQGYRAWDEVVPLGADLKASYKLSLPDWTAVEQAIGRSSVGAMFVLDVDIDIDGVSQTVQSPEFPRQEPAQVAT